MQKPGFAGLFRPVLLAGLTLSIPAFYLLLTDETPVLRQTGNALYVLVALLVAADIALRLRRGSHGHHPLRGWWLDALIVVGALLSAWPGASVWTPFEWTVRLACAALVFARLAQLATHWVGPNNLFQLLVTAVMLMALAGGGFYWLDPHVHSYADGLWLAFTTGATVGYGDLVPSTPASRIFAVFIVLLGYAVFSVVTASISALFVTEDEHRFERELHGDIRALRREIDELRAELQRVLADVPEGSQCRHGDDQSG